MEESPPIDRIIAWSSYLTAEEKMHFDVINIDYIMMDYYWTREFRGFVEGLLREAPSLIFVVGPQGVGKTSALRAMRTYMGELVQVKFWRWGDDYRDEADYWKECRFLLIDLPDYGAGGARKMKKDLDRIGDLWYESRYSRRSLVVTVQKELFRGHYLLGKGEVFELRPLRPGELVYVYVKNFGSTAPFSRDALMRVGRLSRGIFRRFLRYVKLCVLDSEARGGEGVGIDDVLRVVDAGVVGRDMDLELSGFLRGSERWVAASVISKLMVGDGVNQKELAAEVGVSPSTLGRLLRKLELWGYVSRVRGERKELKVYINNQFQR